MDNIKIDVQKASKAEQIKQRKANYESQEIQKEMLGIMKELKKEIKDLKKQIGDE